MAEAERLNLLNPKARFGATKFSDLSKEEFARFYLNARVPAKDQLPAPKNFSIPARPHAIFASGRLQGPDPNNFDWGSTGCITPVYNQVLYSSKYIFYIITLLLISLFNKGTMRKLLGFLCH